MTFYSERSRGQSLFFGELNSFAKVRVVLTSGGIAKVHIVTPAKPPATITAESESAVGS